MKSNLVVIMCSVASVCLSLEAAERRDVNYRVTRDIDLIRTNQAARSGMNFELDECIPAFKLYMDAAVNEPDSGKAKQILGTARECAIQVWGKEGGAWCTNEAIIGGLIAFYERHPTEDAAELLLWLVCPLRLNQSSNTILKLTDTFRTYAGDTRDSRLSIFGLMECVTLEQVNAVIGNNRIDTNTYGRTNLAWDWMRARRGDTNAEERLIQAGIAKQLPKDIRSPVDIGRALGLARTDRILRLAAEQLRTEDYFWSPWRGVEGGQRLLCKREIWMWAIFITMKNERLEPRLNLSQLQQHREFTEPGGKKVLSVFDSDWALDIMEKWCTERLGVKYPDGPRKLVPFVKPEQKTTKEIGQPKSSN